MTIVFLEGTGSVRCIQNPRCRGQMPARNLGRGNQCHPCGWWYKPSSWSKRYDGSYKVIDDVVFLQDAMVEQGGDV